MKLDVHTNDHGEFNGTLGVRRNFGNGLDLEAHLLSVFDSSELQRHWKLCPNSQQPLAPMPHIKGVAKPWASLLRDILPVKIMTSGWGLLRGIVTKISSSFENQAESSVLSEVEVEPALKRRK
jgi:hypothetical protein